MNTLRLFSPSSRNRIANYSLNRPGFPIVGELLGKLANDRMSSPKGPRNIVVPLDETNFAEHALPMALGIAEEFGAVLHLVHVFVPTDELDPYDALYYPGASISSLKRRKTKYLSEAVGRISKATSAFVSGRLVDGRGVPEALNSLSGITPDLIIMATHGRTAFGRLWWGGVAHSLLRASDVPLILVRGNNERPSYEARRVKHVVLPVSGDEAPRKALDSLTEVGVFQTARHTLLHIVPREPKLVIREGALRTEWAPSHENWAAGMRYLRPLARSLRDSGRHVHTRVVSSDEITGPTLLRCAEESNADMIALPHRRRGAFRRLVWPGTTEYLFHNADRPLMFIPT
jgi:nucleotide-binding universal stress UspA family protein